MYECWGSDIIKISQGGKNPRFEGHGLEHWVAGVIFPCLNLIVSVLTAYCMPLSQCLLLFSSNYLCSESFTSPVDIGSLVCLRFLIICFMSLEFLISRLLISVVRCWRNPLNSYLKPDPNSLRLPTDILYWFMILIFCSYIWKNFQSHDALLCVSIALIYPKHVGRCVNDIDLWA